MKIYTKGGDTGETGLFGGRRVPKDELRIRAYGGLDELNAALGVTLADESLPADLRSSLTRIQGELFQLGSELATPLDRNPPASLLEDPEVERLEKEIDAMEATLSPLKTFILPGGAKPAALLHFARTACRRAERDIVSLNRSQPLRKAVLRYINRLSDHLFVCARSANHQLGSPETPWWAP